MSHDYKLALARLCVCVLIIIIKQISSAGSELCITHVLLIYFNDLFIRNLARDFVRCSLLFFPLYVPMFLESTRR